MDISLIVRLAVSIVAAVNAGAAMFGYSPLDVSEDQVYQVVSFVVALATWVWGFWKNNNFTREAQEAQAYLDELKGKGVTHEE